MDNEFYLKGNYFFCGQGHGQGQGQGFYFFCRQRQWQETNNIIIFLKNIDFFRLKAHGQDYSKIQKICLHF